MKMILRAFQYLLLIWLRNSVRRCNLVICFWSWCKRVMRCRTYHDSPHYLLPRRDMLNSAGTLARFKRVEVIARTRVESVDAEKLSHFKKLLIQQLRKNNEQIRTDQAAALELSDDGGQGSVALSGQDLNK